MKARAAVTVGFCVVLAMAGAPLVAAPAEPGPAAVPASAAARAAGAGQGSAAGVAQTARADAEANRVVQGTCRTCHNDRTLRGNLSLERFDVRDAVEHAEVAERMVRKLRAGMMPPPGPRRPDAAALLNLA